jgi:plasmid stabilization system protein ParE
MIYTVVWTPFAERALIDIWIAADDRQAVCNVADAIDLALRNTPYRVGESRTGAVRVVVSPPLGVEYTVYEADRLVEVHAVWKVRSP